MMNKQLSGWVLTISYNHLQITSMKQTE